VAAIRKPPKVEAEEVEILSTDQVAAVLDALRGHVLYPIVALAITSGLRRGELLALQWSDIDLDAGTLKVERSVEETKAGLRIKAPKTKRGRRNIGLSSDAVGMLRSHRTRQLELRLALGQGGQPLIVFSTIEGEMLSPDNLSRDWRRVCNAKGLPRVSFHALRHTHVSMLIKEGTDILTISRRIGHSKASVTLDTYGHFIKAPTLPPQRRSRGCLERPANADIAARVAIGLQFLFCCRRGGD
jgi:integrase